MSLNKGKHTCSSIENTNQPALPSSLRCPHVETLHPRLSKVRPVKILIKLRECAVWSESSLGTHVRILTLWLLYTCIQLWCKNFIGKLVVFLLLLLFCFFFFLFFCLFFFVLLLLLLLLFYLIILDKVLCLECHCFLKRIIFEFPISILLCVLCFQRQPVRFLFYFNAAGVTRVGRKTSPGASP